MRLRLRAAPRLRTKPLNRASLCRDNDYELTVYWKVIPSPSPYLMFLPLSIILLTGLVKFGVLPARPPTGAIHRPIPKHPMHVSSGTLSPRGPALVRVAAGAMPPTPPRRPNPPNSRANQARKANASPFSPLQRDVLYGMLLGDAHLQYMGREVRLEIEQGVKQRIFVDHLLTVFRPYVLAPISALRHTRTVEGVRIPKSYRFTSFTHPYFTEVHHRFYEPRAMSQYADLSTKKYTYIKRIPEQIEAWLTPRVLAYHLMCDGSRAISTTRRPGGVNLATHGFPRDDTMRYCNALEKKFDLHPTLHQLTKKDGKGVYTYIYFPKRDLPALQRVVQPYMLPMFYYKIGLDP